MSVLPVRIDGAEGVAFEDSFQQGVKRECLRSLCRVVNATELPLEVALTTLREAPARAANTPTDRTASQSASPPHRPCTQPQCLDAMQFNCCCQIAAEC